MNEKIHQWADGFLKSKVEPMTDQIAHEFVAISLGVPPSSRPACVSSRRS